MLWPHRPSPEGVFDIMRTHRPTIFYGVPSLYTALLAHKDIGRGAGSDRLRLCVSAGEALPAAVLIVLARREFAQRGHTHHRVADPIRRTNDNATDAGNIWSAQKSKIAAGRDAGAPQARCLRSLKSNCANLLQSQSAVPTRGLV